MLNNATAVNTVTAATGDCVVFAGATAHWSLVAYTDSDLVADDAAAAAIIHQPPVEMQLIVCWVDLKDGLDVLL